MVVNRYGQSGSERDEVAASACGMMDYGGYAYVNGANERFDAAMLRVDLPVVVIGSLIAYYDSLPSTNDVAREEAHRGVPEGLTVIAGVQEKGRGRWHREWRSPAGNIALSVVLYPATERLPYLIMMSSLAVCRTIAEITGLKPGIKWPNDVFIDGRKVCGILIENEIKKDGRNISVTGIGINVDLPYARYSEITDTAASLENELGKKVSRLEIIRSLLINFDRLYAGGDDISTFQAWREMLVTLGQPVKATWKNGSIEGTAENVDASGALVIRLPDGTLHTVVAGDVTLRR